MHNCRAIVIGCSAGGLKALEVILRVLPADFFVPTAVVQHLSTDSPGILAPHLSEVARIPVKEAEDKEPFSPGTVYIAPANYHLLVEKDGTLSLSVDEKENYSRPSIDVLFESATDAYGADLVGVILTGANSDGSFGLKRIYDAGGVTIVQQPDAAEASAMPASALRAVKAHHVLPLERIAALLNSFSPAPNREKASDR